MPTNVAPSTELEGHCFYDMNAAESADLPTGYNRAVQCSTVSTAQTGISNSWWSYAKTTMNRREQHDADMLDKDQSSLRNIVIAVDALNALLGFVCLACFIVSIMAFVLIRESYANHHHHLGNSTTAAEFSRYGTIGDDLFRADDDAAAWANASSTGDIGHHSNRLEQAVSSILVGFGLQIGASCLGIMGALQYNACLTSLATMGYVIGWVLNLLSWDVLGVITTSLCLCPHICFLQQLHLLQNSRRCDTSRTKQLPY
jgi:hypothetical protein